MLEGQAHVGAVADDVSAAQQLGACGVPFFVFDRRYGVSGAQPVETLAAALEHARSAAGLAAP